MFIARVEKPRPSARIIDRRTKWLLRVTLSEVQRLAETAAVRAMVLEQALERSHPEDLEQMKTEIADLTAVADELSATYARLLVRVRT